MCAVSPKRIFGKQSFFFNSTVNTDVYRGIVENFINLSAIPEQGYKFQRDGATARIAATIQFLMERRSSRNQAIMAAPRSPDVIHQSTIFNGNILKIKYMKRRYENLKSLKEKSVILQQLGFKMCFGI